MLTLKRKRRRRYSDKRFIPPSSNGRTRHSGCWYRGSNPWGGAIKETRWKAGFFNGFFLWDEKCDCGSGNKPDIVRRSSTPNRERRFRSMRNAQCGARAQSMGEPLKKARSNMGFFAVWFSFLFLFWQAFLNYFSVSYCVGAFFVLI